MWSKDWTEKLPDFYKYTNTLDQSRDEDPQHKVPSLKNMSNKFFVPSGITV